MCRKSEENFCILYTCGTKLEGLMWKTHCQDCCNASLMHWCYCTLVLSYQHDVYIHKACIADHSMESILIMLYDFQGSESAEQHAVYVWENYVQKAAAKRIAVIAHSYGGIATVEAVSTGSHVTYALGAHHSNLAKIIFTLSLIYPCQRWGLLSKIHVSWQGFSNMASDWLAAVLPVNQMPGLKIFVT